MKVRVVWYIVKDGKTVVLRNQVLDPMQAMECVAGWFTHFDTTNLLKVEGGFVNTKDVLIALQGVQLG